MATRKFTSVYLIQAVQVGMSAPGSSHPDISISTLCVQWSDTSSNEVKNVLLIRVIMWDQVRSYYSRGQIIILKGTFKELWGSSWEQKKYFKIWSHLFYRIANRTPMFTQTCNVGEGRKCGIVLSQLSSKSRRMPNFGTVFSFDGIEGENMYTAYLHTFFRTDTFFSTSIYKKLINQNQTWEERSKPRWDESSTTVVQSFFGNRSTHSNLWQTRG